ncbi:MAG: molybdenum cofactor biosynthesis protein, partial [Desulfuromonas sp.]
MADKVRIGVLTLSDKGSQGQRTDTSGPLLASLTSSLGEVACQQLLPDEQSQIEELLLTWCDREQLDLILTTGGTGLSPRDRTPEATRAVIEREVPGIAEAMRMQNLARTPHAMLSRGIAGLRGKTLIINLPGSPKAVEENLLV